MICDPNKTIHKGPRKGTFQLHGTRKRKVYCKSASTKSSIAKKTPTGKGQIKATTPKGKAKAAKPTKKTSAGKGKAQAKPNTSKATKPSKKAVKPVKTSKATKPSKKAVKPVKTGTTKTSDKWIGSRPHMEVLDVDTDVYPWKNYGCKRIKFEGFYTVHKDTSFTKANGFMDTPKQLINKKWPYKKQFLEELSLVENWIRFTKPDQFKRGPFAGRGPAPDRLSSDIIGATDLFDRKACINWSNVSEYLEKHSVVPSTEFIEYIRSLVKKHKLRTLRIPVPSYIRFKKYNNTRLKVSSGGSSGNMLFRSVLEEPKELEEWKTWKSFEVSAPVSKTFTSFSTFKRFVQEILTKTPATTMLLLNVPEPS